MASIETRDRQRKRDGRPRPVVDTLDLVDEDGEKSKKHETKKPEETPSDENTKEMTFCCRTKRKENIDINTDISATCLEEDMKSEGDERETVWYDNDSPEHADGTSKNTTELHDSDAMHVAALRSDDEVQGHSEWYDNELQKEQVEINTGSKRKVKDITALFENSCLNLDLSKSENYKETGPRNNLHDPLTICKLWAENIPNVPRDASKCIDVTSISDINAHLRTVTSKRKEIGKEGYLYKQGGVDRNQGWKKRWFTFDGKALKYYRDQKNSVSLRIIPVLLMRSVTPESAPKSRSSATDLFSISNRQYQFSLECKQRTFLFGTDNIETSQQWQTTLMAAIIECQKNTTELPYGGEMSSPEISGMVKFEGNRTKYFVAIKGELLRYYHNLEDYAVDCPIHEIYMQRTSIKELKKTSLQLQSPPDQNFILQFDTDIECIQWKTYIENAISRALGDDEILKKVRENEDNKICADCSSSEAEWASINLGIVLCTKCAGPHRSLGVKRSKVRSLRMDNIFRENDNVLRLLYEIGNKNGNSFWNKNPENQTVIGEQTQDIVRQKHIEEKYLKKKFAGLLKLNNIEELNLALCSAVKCGDILAAMQALFSGADINFKNPENNKTVFDVANESGSRVLQEFLEQNKYTDVGAMRTNSVNEKLFPDPAKKTALYHDGFLEKAGPNLRGFLKRWCVLHYGQMAYFKEKNASEQKGSVDLADATSISIVRGQRLYSFDINLQSKSRTYRFAAPDEKSLREWIGSIIQVISPFECNGYDDSLMAGYFYVKTQQTYWAKVWLFLQDQSLNIRHRDDPSIEKIALSQKMKCFQCNVGKYTEKSADVITLLDNNHRIELVARDGNVVTYLQGMTLKDTKTMFSLLDAVLHGRL